MAKRRRRRGTLKGSSKGYIRPGAPGYPSRKTETFVASWRGGETPPASSVAAAMQRAQDACARGRDVTVRAEFTSDDTYWPGHRGRVVAVCENKRWRR